MCCIAMSGNNLHQSGSGSVSQSFSHWFNFIFTVLYFDEHGEKFWTRTRSKYTDLGEFETIWLHKTIRL